MRPMGEQPTAAVRQRCTELAHFLSHWQPVSEGLVKCFFVEDHWSKVPEDWHEPLEALAIDELAQLLIEPPPNAPTSWPDSLVDFVHTVHALRLPGQCRPRTAEPATSAPDVAFAPDGSSSAERPAGAPAAAIAADRHRRAANGRCPEEVSVGAELRRAVKPKKMHEILRLSDLVDEIGAHARCTDVVDLGSGQGYLSRMLAFNYNWSVIAVEAVATNVAAAAKIDAVVQSEMRKKLKDQRDCAWRPETGKLRHVAARLHSGISASAFWRAIAPAANAEAGAGSEGGTGAGVGLGAGSRPGTGAANGGECGAAAATEGDESVAAGTEATSRRPAGGSSVLVGLHTCGDLAPTTLRVFHSASEAVGAVVSVGCCYMHLSESAAQADALNQRKLPSEQPAGPPSDLPAGSPTTAPHGQAAAGVDPTDGPLCEPCDGDEGGGDEGGVGFPMSDHCAELRVRTGFHIREMACHSMVSYAQVKGPGRRGPGRR